MNWFYANAGQQVGPINDADFERLTREGIIQPATLVWREGMQQWEPLANVRGTAPPIPPADSSAATPRQVICSECRKLVPAEEIVQVGNATICATCKPIYVQKLREGTVQFMPAGMAGLRYAGFWVRLGAYLIDYLIQQVLSIPLSLWIAVRLQKSIQPGMMNWNNLIIDYSLAFAFGFTLAILYMWLFVARYGATPGKMLVKIKVVRADGSPVGYALALGRALGEFVSSIPCMLGFLFVAFDSEKRALHDFMCNTRVVYK